MRLRPGVAAGPLIRGFLQNAQVSALGIPDTYVVRLPQGAASNAIRQLAAHLLVDFVEPDRVRRSSLVAPNDPSYTTAQWGLTTVQALQAWNSLGATYLTAATAGTGRVKVAVLDTGADCTHADFKNTGGASTDAALGGQLTWSASQAPIATTIPSPACVWQDDHGHGTHVAGIVAAATSNATGIASLGFSLQVMVYKVLDSSGSGPDSVIANAIVAAVNNGARVVSMSLGGAGYSASLQAAINYAWQRDVLVVAAAGNNSTSILYYPGGANYAMGVGASDTSNNRASFSNFGTGVAIAGPGVNIYSTVPGGYGLASGTSMATPFVSALGGLLTAVTPNGSAAAVMQRIEQSAVSTAAGGAWCCTNATSQSLGYGVINAFNAVSGASRSTTSGGVVGQIVDSLGYPVGGAQVTVGAQTITADSFGLYRMRPVTAGTYNVTVSASGFAAQSLSVTVAPGADSQLSVAMGVAYGKFTGTVSNQGLPFSGAIVQGLSGGLIVGTAVADASGQYALWVPGGSGYTVRASQSGSASASTSGLTVAAGGTTNVNLTLPSLFGAIAGFVQNGSGNPIPGAQVSADSATIRGSAVSGVNGAYSIGHLQPGTYTVTVSAAGYPAPTPQTITVSADGVSNATFQLAIPAPTFNPPAGAYPTPLTVSIATTTPGAAIRYTVDGSTPGPAAGTLYSAPFVLNGAATVQAVAYTSGTVVSPVATVVYTVATTSSWYAAGGVWSKRKRLTIDRTKVSGSLTGFPVLVSLTDAALQSDARADGNDILFTAGDGVTKLSHEIERYNSASGQLIAWVKVPVLSSTSDTTVYLYFGNAAAGSQQDAGNVWDSGYRGVYHLGNGVTLAAGDSTVNGNHASALNGTAAGAGWIGGGASPNGSPNVIVLGTAGFAVPAGSSVTFSGWARRNATSQYGSDQALATREGSTYAYNTLAETAAGLPRFSLRLSNFAVHTVTGSSAVAAGGWNHLAGRFDTVSKELSVWLNGVKVASSIRTGLTLPVSAAGAGVGLIGGGGNGPNAYNKQFSGGLDEIRFSVAARSDDWIVTEYNNQSAPGSFLSVGALETSGGGPATVAVTVASTPAGRTLTVDGSGCTAPCAFQWAQGSNHTIAAATQAGSAGTQYVFGSWSDGGGATHGVTTPGAATTYTASFGTQHYVTTAASPSGGGTITPASGWFNAGTVVSVNAAPVAGYTFSGFSGALSGSTTPQNLTVSGPASATAAFTIVQSSSWYGVGGVWTKRKPLTINRTRVAGALADFPVLVSVTDPDLQAGARADGNDILFTAGDGVTKLHHEIERYSAGQLVAWVRAPSLSPAADTILYLYFGNAASASQQNAAGVWDGSFKAVYHLGNGAVLSGGDSTANGNHATALNGTPAAAGWMGGGAAPNGSPNVIALATAGFAVPAGSSVTFSGWARRNGVSQYGSDQALATREGSIYAYNTLAQSSSGLPRFSLRLSDFAVHTVTGPSPVAAGAWNHLIGRFDNVTKELSVWLNGVKVASSIRTGLSMTSSAGGAGVGLIGGAGNGPSAYNKQFSGGLDEIRFSVAARSDDWIVTEYNNQSAPGNFLSVGAVQTSGGSPATVAVTVASTPAGRTLTVDGSGCTAPCAFQWAQGSNHTIAAASQPGGAGTQHVFGSWSDGGGATHGVTTPGAATTYTASFGTQHYVTTAASPSGGGSITPASGWFNAGTVVPIHSAANATYTFSGFSPPLSGIATPQNLAIAGPATITANFYTRSLSGCPLLPADSIWNAPVDTLPVDANSDLYINTIGANTGLHPDFSATGYGIPFVVVPATQPTVPISFTYSGESDAGPYPIPPNVPVEGGSDRHVIIVDSGSCRLYEVFNARTQNGGASWTGGSGAVFNLASNQLRPAGWTSADAAGLPILPGLIRYDEVLSGDIRHAVRMTAPQTRSAYVWPARHEASDLTGPQFPPMGQRFRLKATFGITGYPAEVQVILRALKKYGTILADNGSSWYLTGAPDTRWDDNALHSLVNVLGSNFEAVDVSSLMVHPDSGATRVP